MQYPVVQKSSALFSEHKRKYYTVLFPDGEVRGARALAESGGVEGSGRMLRREFGLARGLLCSAEAPVDAGAIRGRPHAPGSVVPDGAGRGEPSRYGDGGQRVVRIPPAQRLRALPATQMPVRLRGEATLVAAEGPAGIHGLGADVGPDHVGVGDRIAQGLRRQRRPRRGQHAAHWLNDRLLSLLCLLRLLLCLCPAACQSGELQRAVSREDLRKRIVCARKRADRRKEIFRSAPEEKPRGPPAVSRLRRRIYPIRVNQSTYASQVSSYRLISLGRAPDAGLFSRQRLPRRLSPGHGAARLLRRVREAPLRCAGRLLAGIGPRRGMEVEVRRKQRVGRRT